MRYLRLAARDWTPWAAWHIAPDGTAALHRLHADVRGAVVAAIQLESGARLLNRLDAAGNEIWRKEILLLRTRALAPLADGGFAVAGELTGPTAIDGREIRKVIVVPGRLVNIVV